MHYRLAIETSCDETSVSIIAAELDTNGFPTKIKILSHCVESQTQIHAPFGGVVPEVAARDHLLKIYPLAECALKEAGINADKLEKIVVTMGPGLIGALMVGVLFARGLALSLSIPVIAINHIDAHLSPCFLLPTFSSRNDLKKELAVPETPYPAIALTVSGGHCHMSYLTSAKDRKIIGKSSDDACGEAFDKVGKLLGLPYPGGPHIEKLSQKFTESGKENKFNFPKKISDKDNLFGFSYSGLKTAVLNAVKQHTTLSEDKKILNDDVKEEIAYAFQEAAISQLYNRLENALKKYPETRIILIAGGVAQNSFLREKLSTLTVPCRFAPIDLCSDNATMIGLHSFIDDSLDGTYTQPFSRYNESP